MIQIQKQNPFAVCHFLCHCYDMQCNATPLNGPPEAGQQGHQHRPGAYHKALDARKRPIRGLWMRDGRYYARLAIEDPQTGKKQVRRVPFQKARTVAEAQKELRRLLTERDKQDLPVLRRTPKFADYVKQYFDYYEQAKDSKRPRTLETERVHLRSWEAHLGHVRLDLINPAMINAYIAARQGGGVTGRTVNLAVTILRNVLNRAIDDGWIKSLPTQNLRPLKWTPRKRELFSLEQILDLCEAAPKVSKNGAQVVDYIKLLAFCGSRMSETFRLKWSDVDWTNRQLTIGADGQSKNHKARVVDFNSKLEAHLKEMQTRKAPESDWIFPSPQRGEQDRAAKSFRETLLAARREAKLPTFGFHDCRHYYISMCVMAGIDYMTIARWVGHQDGGILIGKVYGHLSDEHARKQAERLNFL